MVTLQLFEQPCAVGTISQGSIAASNPVDRVDDMGRHKAIARHGVAAAAIDRLSAHKDDAIVGHVPVLTIRSDPADVTNLKASIRQLGNDEAAADMDSGVS